MFIVIGGRTIYRQLQLHDIEVILYHYFFTSSADSGKLSGTIVRRRFVGPLGEVGEFDDDGRLRFSRILTIRSHSLLSFHGDWGEQLFQRKMFEGVERPFNAHIFLHYTPSSKSSTNALALHRANPAVVSIQAYFVLFFDESASCILYY